MGVARAGRHRYRLFSRRGATFFGLPTAEAMERAMMAEIEECLKAILGNMMPKYLLMTWVPAEFKSFDQTLKTF
jgi:hypothetical protein